METPARANFWPLGETLGFDVSLDFLERVPGEFAAVEDGGVFGLAQIKQVGRLEHGLKVMEKDEKSCQKWCQRAANAKPPDRNDPGAPCRAGFACSSSVEPP